MSRPAVLRARNSVHIVGRGGLAALLVVVGSALLPATDALAAGGTYNVTTTADIAATAGACAVGSTITTAPSPLSLREALCLADNAGGAVTVNVPAGTYTATNGELRSGRTPGQTVTINGAGSASTIIRGSGNARVFDFDPDVAGGVTTNLGNVTVTNGRVDTTFGGAGIIAGSDNAASIDALTLTNVVVTDNRANDGAPNTVGQTGGGLKFAGGQLTVVNSVFSNNASNSSAGAGIAYQRVGNASGQSLVVDGTTFSGNTMTNTTGGTNVPNGGALSLSGSGVVGTVRNSRFVNNVVTATTGPGRGAAILASTGTLTVTESTFTGNSVSGGNASSGGAVYLAATEVVATLRHNRFAGNSAPTGSAIASISNNANASPNWFGCNAGPGSAGCDTVAGSVTVNPRLQLSATANPSTVTGPNGTSTISALFSTDSSGAAVSGSNLDAFNGAAATFSDPPGDATVTNSPGAQNAAFGTGTGRADIDYHSGTVTGPNPVNVSFDNQTVTATPTVQQRPTITSPDSATFRNGQFSSFTITTTGYPTPAVTRTGSLPNGLTFTDNGDGTATIAGTPTGAGGSYPQSLTATNGATPNATQTLTLSVGQAPAFTSPNTATFRIGQAGSFTVTTSGNPTVDTITESGTLPAGMTFTDNGDGTATIAGTPTGTGNTYPVTLRAENGVSPNATQNLTVQVNQSPSVTSNPVDQTVQSGTSVSFSASASGVPTPSVQWQRDTGSGFANVAGATSTTYTFTAAAGDDSNRYRAVFTNTAGSATTTAATLHVGSAPAFTSANTASFVEGRAGSFDVDTTGMPKATLSRTGAQFPSWLTLTDNGDGTGTLAGTPPAGSGGQYQFSLRATNGFSPSASQTFTLFVDASPEITSADHATFTAGQANSFAVTTTAGYPTATSIDVSGALPAGVTFTDNGDGTATLAGNPATGTGGTYSLTLNAEATGGQADPDTQSFTLTVNEAPRITSTDHTTFAVGTAGSFTVTTSPANPSASTLTETGSLPAGLSFVDNGDGTATIAGTPNAGTGGVYTLSVNASNGVGSGASQSFTLTINQPPRITSANRATFVRDVAGSFTVTTTGGQPATTTVTETGALPAGVTFTDNGDGTATLAGTPTADGTFAVQLTASNGVQPDATQSFTLTVNAPPTITSTDHATFTAGSAGSFTVTTNAGTPAATTLVRSGALPGGITFTDNGDGTASLAGTPATGSGGSYPLTVTAANGVNPDAVQSFTLTVNEAPRITSPDHASFRLNTGGSFTVTTAPAFPNAVTLTETGALPAGLSFTDNGDGTGTISGTPTADGTYPITVRAANGVNPDDSQSFTLVVSSAPGITSADAATFAVGDAGTFTVTTNPGVPAGTTLTKSGALPSGVTFTDNGDGTATLAGTPATGSGGAYPLTITASNGVPPNAQQTFTLTVTDPPAITSPDEGAFTVGDAGTFTVTTRAGFPSVTTLTEAGALPAGLSFTDNGDGTAVITGTPAAGTGGVYPITLTATNSAGQDDQAYTLTVYESAAITSADTTTFTAGSAGSFTVTTAGGFPTPPAVTATGSLPNGVTFTDNGDGTATLAGTPTSGGVYPLALTVTNGKSVDGGQSFTLTVNGPPAITSAASATFTEGVTDTFTVTTRAGVPTGPLAITSTGALPPGVLLVDNGDGTATLGGTATKAGAFALTLTASNGTAPDPTQSFTLTVKPGRVVELPVVLPAKAGTLRGIPATVRPGQQLRITGTGFAAGAPVTVGLYPSRVVLARVTADASGAFTTTITVPATLGRQTFVAAGIDDTNEPQFLQAQSRVVAEPGSSDPGRGDTGDTDDADDPSGRGDDTPSSGGSESLADTNAGIDPWTITTGAAGLLLAGLALVVAARRRRVAGRHRTQG